MYVLVDRCGVDRHSLRAKLFKNVKISISNVLRVKNVTSQTS